MRRDCKHCFHHGKLKDGKVGCAVERTLGTSQDDDVCAEFIEWNKERRGQ